MSAKFILLNGSDAVTEQLYDLEYFEYLSKVYNYVVAIALVILIIAITFMTFVDIFYLTFSPFKVAYDAYIEAAHTGVFARAMHFLVSKNAIGAFEDASVNNSSVYLCYLKRMIRFYIITALIIAVLAGGLPTLMKIVLKLISGVSI